MTLDFTEVEREALLSCAGRLGLIDSQRDNRSDQYIVNTVLDRFDREGELRGEITKQDRDEIIASYSAGRSVLEY